MANGEKLCDRRGNLGFQFLYSSPDMFDDICCIHCRLHALVLEVRSLGSNSIFVLQLRFCDLESRNLSVACTMDSGLDQVCEKNGGS